MRDQSWGSELRDQSWGTTVGGPKLGIGIAFIVIWFTEKILVYVYIFVVDAVLITFHKSFDAENLWALFYSSVVYQQWRASLGLGKPMLEFQTLSLKLGEHLVLAGGTYHTEELRTKFAVEQIT